MSVLSFRLIIHMENITMIQAATTRSETLNSAGEVRYIFRLGDIHICNGNAKLCKTICLSQKDQLI